MKSIGLVGIGEFCRYSIIASSSASSGTHLGEIFSVLLRLLPSDERLVNERPLLLALLLLLESLLLPLLLLLAPLTEDPLDATPLELVNAEEAPESDAAAFTLSSPEEERKVRDRAFMLAARLEGQCKSSHRVEGHKGETSSYLSCGIGKSAGCHACRRILRADRGRRCVSLNTSDVL